MTICEMTHQWGHSHSSASPAMAPPPCTPLYPFFFFLHLATNGKQKVLSRIFLFQCLYPKDEKGPGGFVDRRGKYTHQRWHKRRRTPPATMQAAYNVRRTSHPLAFPRRPPPTRTPFFFFFFSSSTQLSPPRKVKKKKFVCAPFSFANIK